MCGDINGQSSQWASNGPIVDFDGALIYTYPVKVEKQK